MTEKQSAVNETKASPEVIPGVGRAGERWTILAAVTPPAEVMKTEGTRGQIFRIQKSRLIIGSLDSADIRIPQTSPIHAILEIEANPDGSVQATLFDLASESGTRVNGVACVTQELKTGDQIEIAGYRVDIDFTRQKAIPQEGRAIIEDVSLDQSAYLIEEPSRISDIFEAGASNNQALEVVMSWCHTILNVRHFVNESIVTIGTKRRDHFGIPPLLSSEAFPLARKTGETYEVTLDAKMQGVVYQSGKLIPVQQLLEKGSTLQMKKRDFLKLTIGDIHFYLSMTEAPPHLKHRMSERDPFFYRLMGSSLFVTLAFMIGVQQVKVPEVIEAEQLPERMAAILFQPVKPPVRIARVDPTPSQQSPEVKKDPTPKATVKIEIQPKAATEPKPIPKEMQVGSSKESKDAGAKGPGKGAVSAKQNEAKEGAGARAKGQEGTRGSKNAKLQGEPQNRAQRPSPNAASSGSGAKGNSQVPGTGNADLFKGVASRIENILGNSGGNLGQGGQKLSGFGGFTTEGKGGLALSGEGSGGGGTADTKLGGLSDQGIGGGKVGTGLGASGTGTGMIGGKTRVAIRSGGAEEAVVMGSIDADAVEAALLAHRDEFRLCYERELNAENPKLAGRVGTTFVIGSSGRVTQAGIASTSLGSPLVEQCILKVIRRIDFPIPRGAGIVQVSYPFKFAPAGTR